MCYLRYTFYLEPKLAGCGHFTEQTELRSQELTFSDQCCVDHLLTINLSAK